MFEPGKIFGERGKFTYRVSIATANLRTRPIGPQSTGWPKKVSHYQESSLYHIKIASAAAFLTNFEYKIRTRML